MSQQPFGGSRPVSSSGEKDPDKSAVEEAIKQLLAEAWDKIQQLNPCISPEGFAQLAYAVAAAAGPRKTQPP